MKYETERLIFKPTHPKDASFLLELWNSPKWLKYIGDRKINSNVSSQKLLKKLGLEYIKMIRIPNDNEELMLFEIHIPN